MYSGCYTKQMLAAPAISALIRRAARLPPLAVAIDAANSLKALRASVRELVVSEKREASHDSSISSPGLYVEFVQVIRSV